MQIDRASCLVVFGLLVCGTSPVKAGSYSFAPIGPPTTPNSDTAAFGINNSGQVVGQVISLTTGVFSGFLYSGGVYIPIDDPNGSVNGAFGTVPVAINGAGQIVGTYVDSNVNVHAFLYSGGTYQTLIPPSMPGVTIANSGAGSINDKGQILLAAVDTNGNAYNYLYASGQYTLLTALSTLGPSAYANCINDAETIVGFSTDSQGVNHGFLLQSGKITTLDDPNGGPPPFPQPFAMYGTQANAINNTGEVVGFYNDMNSLAHGFVYQDGDFTTVDDPLGANGTFLYGINDQGQLAGYYLDANFTAHAFVATPTVPEPGSLTLVAVAGLAATGWHLKKGRATV
jgi:probable HAF family extracellular repeat protein